MIQFTIEDEFDAALVAAYSDAFGKEPHDDWMTALRMRFGTAGTISTLDDAGTAIGVTRERVRQITSKVTPRLAGAELTLARAVAEQLALHSPVQEPIGELLSKSGLSRPNLTGASYLNMLFLVGITPKDLIGTDLMRRDGWVVEASEEPVMKALTLAKKHTSKYGMTTVEEIRQELATVHNPLDRDDVERVLHAQKNVKWHGDWLWVEKGDDHPHANRLVNVARSILSVNSPQRVTSIHAGARRLWKFRKLDVLPPIEAMKGFLDASPHFVVDGDLVSHVGPLDYRDLGDVTATMIDVLKATPYQVTDRQSLSEACEAAGIAKGTSGIWTTYAEWMERYAPNVWGLRGANPNPAAVEEIRLAALKRAKAEPRRKTWAWAPGGAVVQTMDVTTSMLNSGVMSIDPGIQQLLSGQSFEVFRDGERIAAVKVGADHTFSWGWYPVLTALGAQQGDVLQIRIDIGNRTADVRLGAQELWS